MIYDWIALAIYTFGVVTMLVYAGFGVDVIWEYMIEIAEEVCCGS